MKRELKFNKGDKCIIAIIPMSNASRRVDMSLKNINNWTWEGEVISVGRKYITVKWGCHEEKFVIENNYTEKTNYSSDYILYENFQEIYNKKESEEINTYIKDKLGTYGEPRITLDKLKRIKEIIDEGK